MSTYPNLKNDPELLKIKTKVDEIKNFKNKIEERDHENLLKSLRNDKEYYKNKYEKVKKK